MKKSSLILILILAVAAFIAVYTMQSEKELSLPDNDFIANVVDTGEEVEQDADDIAEEVEDVIQGIIDEVENEIEKDESDTEEEKSEDADADDQGEEVEGSEDSEDNTAEDTDTTVIVENSGYLEYSQEEVDTAIADGKNVALFFHADRCPSCVRLNADITENVDGIDSNTVILKVNYDAETELKDQYGVTKQHTIVYLDSNGNATNIDTSSLTLEDLEANR